MSAQLLRCCCGAACCAVLGCNVPTGDAGTPVADLQVTGSASLEVYDTYQPSGWPLQTIDEDASISAALTIPMELTTECSHAVVTPDDIIESNTATLYASGDRELVRTRLVDINSEFGPGSTAGTAKWRVSLTLALNFTGSEDVPLFDETWAYTYQVIVEVVTAAGQRPCATVVQSSLVRSQGGAESVVVLVPATVSVDNAGACPSSITIAFDGGGVLASSGDDYARASGLLTFVNPNVGQCGSGELGPGCTGACCDAGVCTVTDEETCVAGDGVWHGGGTDCGDIECGSTGPGVNPTCCNTRCAANNATISVEYDVLVRITRRACCSNNRVDGIPVEAPFVDSESINLGSQGCQDISAIITLGTITLPNPCGGPGTIVEDVVLYVESSCALVRPGLTRPLTSVEVQVGTQAGGGARVLSAAYVRFESDNEGGPLVNNCANAVPDDFFAYRVEIFGEIRLVGRGEC